MADVPFPRSWKEAVPYIVWGIVVFSFGLEGVVALLHGEWLQAITAFGALFAVVAVTLHWQDLKERASSLDARWVVASLFVALIAIPVSSELPVGIWPWLLSGVAAMAIVTAGYLYSRTAPVVRAPASAAPAVAPSDPQASRDLLFLLNFAVDQATVAMLDGFIQLSSGPDAKTDIDSSDPDRAAEAKRWFIGYVAGRLGDGTIRKMEFGSVVMNAQAEAEHNLEKLLRTRGRRATS